MRSRPTDLIGLHPTRQLSRAKEFKIVQHGSDSKMGLQKHFLWTIVGPDSSYSALEIHIFWKVLNDDKMEPPIHTEYLRSGGAITLILTVDGANQVNSFVMRSPIRGNMVVPPERTTFAYRSLRISTSHLMPC